MTAISGNKPRRLYTLALWGALFLLLQSLLLLFSQNDFQLKTNLIVQLVALAAFAFFSKNAAHTYLNAPLVFAGSIFIWHSTFLLGYYFDLAPIFEFPGDTFDIGFDHIYKATALVGLSLALTIVGMLWGYKREKRAAEASPALIAVGRARFSTLGPAAKRVVWYLLGGMTLVLLLFFFREGRGLFERTYLEFYQQDNLSLVATVFYRSEYVWAFVIVLAVAYYKDSSRMRVFIACAISATAVLLAMLGPRTGPFLCLATLLLSWDCFVQHVKSRWIGAFVLFLAAASYVIGAGRETGIGAHVFQFGDTGREKLELLDLFSEQGKSIAVVLRTIEFTQRGGAAFGRTFLDAAISVVPLPVLNFLGYKFAPSLTGFVVDSSPNSIIYAGPGSSLVAEFYYNFGILGCLGFMAIGWFIAKSYFTFIFWGDIFSGVQAATVASMYTAMMRNDFASSFRLILYALIILYILRKKRQGSMSQVLSGPGRYSQWIPAQRSKPMLADGEA